ncbi:hypothetical protein AVEN_114546-1 [Araneus ventricosus]|uniref:Uncharacterized protein n=1 Tax=Araneus ventricosus TaxID=182803 RepID=A0A4Y2SZG6_ARAVE|nr:hypothetical protein AVEN_114546-1 [Araneus ventricosus]
MFDVPLSAATDELTTGIEFEEDFLHQFLRHRKYNSLRAFQYLQKYLNFRRSHSSIFQSIPDEHFKGNPATKFISVLPYRCPDGCIIILSEFGKWNPNDLSLEYLKREAIASFLQPLRCPKTQITGLKIIHDFKNTVKHMRYCTPQNVLLVYNAACVMGSAYLHINDKNINSKINNKLNNIKKFIDSCENTITDKTQIVITAQQKLNGVKVLEEEVETLFKQYLDIEEDEKSSNKSDEEMLELLEERDEIELSLKCLLSKYNVNEVAMIENKSNHDSDLKSYVDHIELKSKLPEIPLPIFYGKIEEFSNFKNQFVSLMSDNKELTNDQKLFYLKADLRGEAKLIETSDDTFESLFSALEERFENKRAVVDIHIQNMLKIEKLNFESSKGLRNITDTINKSLRALKSFKLDCNNLANAILVNIILERLDKDTRKAYELFIQTKGIPSLNELLKFLESRAMVLDQLGNTPSNNKFRKEFQGSAYKSKNFFVNSNKGNHVIKKCILCTIDHPLHKCYEFLKLSIAKRIEFIEKHHLCRNCLKMHNAPRKSTFLCRECHKSGHNSLIHLDSKNQSNITPSNITQSNANFVPLESNTIHNVNSERYVSSSETQSMTNVGATLTSNTKVSSNILCTVQLLIENEYGQKIKIKAILDSGS